MLAQIDKSKRLFKYLCNFDILIYNKCVILKSMFYKVFYKKEIHKFKVDQQANLQKLKAQIKSSFHRLPDRYCLTYKDEHRKTVSLEKDSDLKFIINSGTQTNIKLYIEQISENFCKKNKQLTINSAKQQMFTQRTKEMNEINTEQHSEYWTKQQKTQEQTKHELNELQKQQEIESLTQICSLLQKQQNYEQACFAYLRIIQLLQYKLLQTSNDNDRYAIRQNIIFMQQKLKDAQNKTKCVQRQPIKQTIKPIIKPTQINKLKHIPIQNKHLMIIQMKESDDLRKLCSNPGTFPYSSIGFLQIQFTNGVSGFGTGFLIRPYVILTAAHNLYNRSEKVSAKNVILHMVQHQKQKGKKYPATCAYIPREFKQQQNEEKSREFDFAILIISAGKQLMQMEQKFGYFQLNHLEIKKDDQVYLYGYPQNLSYQQRIKDKSQGIKPRESYLFGCKNTIVEVQQKLLIHRLSASPGQSGSPIYRWSFIYDCYQAIGIHIYGFGKNKAVKITKAIINRIEDWILAFKQSYGNQQRLMFDRQNWGEDIIKINQLQIQEILYQKNPDEFYKTAQVEQVQKFDLRKALRFYRKALTIYERKQPQSRMCGRVLHNMGVIYNDQGSYESALACYNRSLVIKEKESGKNSADYATTLGNIGSVQYYQGNLQKARSLYNEALTINEKILGKEDISLITQINNIGVIQSELNNYDESITLHERALKIASNHYGANHIQCTPCLINLSSSYRKKGNILQAKQHSQRAIKIFQSNKVQKHDGYAISLIIMGDILYDQGNVKQAMEQWKKAKKILEQILGPNNKNQNYKRVCWQIENGI